jgi:uncharacterized cupin superfamily protein
MGLVGRAVAVINPATEAVIASHGREGMSDTKTVEQVEVVRSFVNLRAFAEKHAPPVSIEECVDPFLASRVMVPLASGPITVGTIVLGAGEGHVPQMPATEFVIVHKGAIALQADGSTLKLTEGESAVLTEGVEITWSTVSSATLIFMRREGGEAGPSAMIPIDVGAPLGPSNLRGSELLVGSMPQCRNHTDYSSVDGEFGCGTWDATPFHRGLMFYSHCELMYLVEGSVTFEDEAGRRETFAQGDIFFVAQGARCSWESPENLTKVWATYRPA